MLMLMLKVMIWCSYLQQNQLDLILIGFSSLSLSRFLFFNWTYTHRRAHALCSTSVPLEIIVNLLFLFCFTSNSKTSFLVHLPKKTKKVRSHKIHFVFYWWENLFVCWFPLSVYLFSNSFDLFFAHTKTQSSQFSSIEIGVPDFAHQIQLLISDVIRTCCFTFFNCLVVVVVVVVAAAHRSRAGIQIYSSVSNCVLFCFLTRIFLRLRTNHSA